MTLVERAKSLFNTILGWGIPGLILIFIFAPGLLLTIGTLIGRAIESAFGSGIVILKRVVKAIQKTRKEGKDLNQSLESELNEEDKIEIRKLKEKEGIK